MDNIVLVNKRHRYEKGVIYINEDYIGKKCNMWTIVRFSHMSISPAGKRRQVWICKCDCGKEKPVLIGSVICGKSRSCGCYYKEIKKCERLPSNIAAVNSKYSSYKNSAKKRNISFELTVDEFDKLTHGNCYYCGKEPARRNFQRKTSSYSHYMNGVDRIDSNGGYTVKNCVSCCDTCNRAKLDHSLTYFIEWIKSVSSRIEHIENDIKAIQL